MENYEIYNKLNNVLSLTDKILNSGYVNGQTFINLVDTQDYINEIKKEIYDRMQKESVDK